MPLGHKLYFTNNLILAAAGKGNPRFAMITKEIIFEN